MYKKEDLETCYEIIKKDPTLFYAASKNSSQKSTRTLQLFCIHFVELSMMQLMIVNQKGYL